MSKTRPASWPGKALQPRRGRRTVLAAASKSMLSVRDILELPGLDLTVAAGAAGLDRPVRWLHVSELADPTPFLEGGEFLLTTGLALDDGAATQQTYVRRLATHGLAGLGFGVGFGFADVPEALLREADRDDFPVLVVPYEVPFVAITKAAFAHLANEELERQTRALQVNERLADAVLAGRGLDSLLAIVCAHLGCSLAVFDEAGRLLAERHAGKRLAFDGALELPAFAGGVTATLRAVRNGRPFDEYDRLVLHHGQTALAFELSRRRAVSAAELRLAGDLLDDLEHDRLADDETERRIAAFGLDPHASYTALLAVAANGAGGERLRRAVADELNRRGTRYLSALRPDRAAFLAQAADEEQALALAEAVAAAVPHSRVGVGRPGRGRALGRSLVEAAAALEVVHGRVASYRDLGSVELLLSLPEAALEGFVQRVLGPAARNDALVESLTVLLDCGYRWSDAAERLRVHRHTLRYRMDRLREQTGLDPDEPAQRLELWLAVKAAQALAARQAHEVHA
jgi:purine catabolism regulator